MSARGKEPRPPDDPSALRFVLAWLPMIRGLMLRHGVPFDDVDDAVQVILFAAWRAALDGRLRHDQPAAVVAWLRVASRRLAKKWAVKSRRFAILDHDVAAREDDAEAPSIARDMLAELQAATTPERWRAWLALAEGSTLAEIAAAEGIPQGTVATRVWLARRDFTAAIAREHAREQNPLRRLPK